MLLVTLCSDCHPKVSPGREDQVADMASLERTTGFEPATPTLAIAWRSSHASPSVSAVPLSCTFLALLSHPSHQIAGVDSISLVISLGLPLKGTESLDSPVKQPVRPHG